MSNRNSSQSNIEWFKYRCTCSRFLFESRVPIQSIHRMKCPKCRNVVIIVPDHLAHTDNDT